MKALALGCQNGLSPSTTTGQQWTCGYTGLTGQYEFLSDILCYCIVLVLLLYYEFYIE